MEWGNTLLDDYVLGLTGVERPRVCFLPTASGDADHYVVRFYRAFGADRCEPSHISLFRRETGVGDPREHLLSQDLVYVGGGSVISLLGTWQAHGLGEILHEAWQSGVVMCGGSAGSLCWFSEAGERLPRGRGPARRRARLPAVEQRGPLQRRAGTAGGVRRRDRGRHGAGLRRRRRVWRCTSSAPNCPTSCRRGRVRALVSCLWTTRESPESVSSRSGISVSPPMLR